MDVRVKNWCFWIVVLEKTLEHHSDYKEIKPVSPKGNQPWIFIGRTDAEAEISILWPPDVKNWLIGKDPDAGKDWRQEEKGTAEDEMVGWHHRLDGHEFEQALWVDTIETCLVSSPSRPTPPWFKAYLIMHKVASMSLTFHSHTLRSPKAHPCRKTKLLVLV